MTKGIFTLCTAVLMTLNMFAQAPQKMSFQAVVRDADNALVSSTAVGMQISILQGSSTGNPVYVETQTPNTNANGLVSLEIGNGTVVTGDFTTIDWAAGIYFIKTETDPTGGTNYTITGTSQLLTVPYAMHANTADSLIGGANRFSGNYSDLTNQPITVTAISANQDTLFLSNNQFFVSGSSATGEDPALLPTITTTITDVGSNSATFSSTMDSVPGFTITERGFLYSFSDERPTINLVYGSDVKFVVNSRFGNIDTTPSVEEAALEIAVMQSNLTYYARAYAITESNIYIYGEVVSFTTKSVGQTGPSGGIVFFDKGKNTNGWQYLEAAPSDLPNFPKWGCRGTGVVGGTTRLVGNGEENTQRINNTCPEVGIAAEQCADAVIGGQDDWFLPSIGELELIYNNLYRRNGYIVPNSFSSTTRYWTSTEILAETASTLSFVSFINPMEATFKSSGALVRPIRAY
jgi:hypothetical protein